MRAFIIIDKTTCHYFYKTIL